MLRNLSSQRSNAPRSGLLRYRAALDAIVLHGGCALRSQHSIYSMLSAPSIGIPRQRNIVSIGIQNIRDCVRQRCDTHRSGYCNNRGRFNDSSAVRNFAACASAFVPKNIYLQVPSRESHFCRSLIFDVRKIVDLECGKLSVLFIRSRLISSRTRINQ